MLKISSAFINQACENEEEFEDAILRLKITILAHYYKGAIPMSEIIKFIEITEIGKLLVLRSIDISANDFVVIDQVGE